MEHGFVLLGGDTVVPSGLYARLCHAFSSVHIFCYLIYFSFIFFFSVSGPDVVKGD